MLYIASLPLWQSALLMVGLPTVVAMLGPILVRHRIALERLATNNEVAGFKFAVVGVVYAVLIAFAVIVVWEKLSDAEHAVAQEAGASAALYRLANGIGDETGGAIRDKLTAYLRATVEEDWPTMAQGGAGLSGTRALNDVYAAVLAVEPRNDRLKLVLPEIFHQLDVVTQARRTRLVLASGAVPGILWLVLFVGAFLTIGYTFFFATENLRAQSLMSGMLSVLISMVLLVIVVVDHPYAGYVRVTPESLRLVLEEFSALASLPYQ